jgi:hypothetical protein
MKRAAFLVLAACGHPATTPVSNHGGITATPHAAMFEAGHAWTYEVTESGTSVATTTTQVTCRVAAVGAFPGGVSSQIACDGKDLDHLVAGIWIETGRGLYVGEAPLPDGTAPTLDDQHLILPATPREDSRHLDFDEGSEDFTVHQDGPRWCFEEDTSNIGGDGADVQCFDQDGIASGSSSVAEESDPPNINKLVFTRLDAKGAS